MWLTLLMIILFIVILIIFNFNNDPDKDIEETPKSPILSTPPSSPIPPSTPSPLPSPPATPTPTLLPSPLATPTPTPPLPTPTPTPTPAPTPTPTPILTPTPSPPPSPNPLGEPMFFPTYVNDIESLTTYLQPFCNSHNRRTYAIPWDCYGRIYCNYFGIRFHQIPCNGPGLEGKYSFVADGCVPEWQSDCPFYPLNIL
jgi:hypothetical protein